MDGSPYWITTSSILATLSEGASINFQLEAGYILYPIVSFTIVDGFLPPGLELSIEGLISGTTEVVWQDTNYSFTVRITDSQGFFADQLFAIVVLDDDTPPIWDSNYSDQIPTNLGLFIENNVVNIQLLAIDEDNKPLYFSLLNGNLPPGLSVSETGLISGTIGTGNSPITVTPYQFTIRLTDLIISTDRSFIIDVQGINSAPVFITTGPSLGSFNEGQFIEIQIVVQHFDPVPLIFSISSGALPPGVTINSNGLISGSIEILPIIQSITYSFTVAVNDEVVIVTNNFYIQVNPFVSLMAAPSITWITPSGSLGSIPETYPSYFSVMAVTTVQSVIIYTVDTILSISQFPYGFTLDPTTGFINGFAQYVTQPTTFTFIIMASIPGASSQRSFSITITPQFITKPVESVYARITGFDKLNWHSYINDLAYVPSNQIFRPNDPQYGINFDPKIYIIGGLAEVSSQAFWSSITTSPDYGASYAQKTYLYVGPVNYAVVRNSAGRVLYEVIYRTIIDPLNLAGGFMNGLPQPLPGPNGQVYPPSINNMRQDITYNLGTNGTERLPLWMSSLQDISNPNSAIGYIPAIELVNVLPGTAATIVQNIQETNSDSIFLGKKIIFDRYLSIDFDVYITGFDLNDTQFDDELTIFDELIQEDQQYFLFPPNNA